MRYTMNYPLAARAEASERAAFVRRTYAHLAGAILAFVGLETLLISIPHIEDVVLPLMLGSRLSWLVVLLLYGGASWIANQWAVSDTSIGMQYLGLALYVVAETVIFLPLLLMANLYSPNAIPTAGIVTLGLFGGLTASVFITRGDYSFLGPVLTIGFFITGAIILASLLFPFINMIMT